MTRNEAINFLKVYRNEELYTEECRNAHERAIEALEQEPCGDCISRESIIGIVNHQRFGMSKLAFSIIAEKVKELPSVTPQPKMGHWITTRTLMHDGEYYCDKCKCDAPNNKKWDYCPNCGAEMQKVEV